MNSSFNESFQNIDLLIKQGRFSDAEKKIEEAKESIELTVKQNLSLNNLKLTLLASQKRLDESLELADQIIEEGENHNEDLEKIDALLEKAYVYFHMRSSEECSSTLKLVSKNIKRFGKVDQDAINKRKARLESVSGWLMLLEEKHIEALEHFKNSLEIYKQFNDQYLIANALKEIGLAFFYLGNFEETLNYADLSIELLQDLKLDYAQASIYDLIAGIHYNQGSLSQALELAGKSLALYESLENKLKVAEVTQRIGYIYKMAGDASKAMENFLKSKEKYEELKLYQHTAKIMVDISEIFRERGEYDKALELLNIYYNNKKELKDEPCLAIAHSYFGSTYASIGELEEAEKHLNDSLKISKKLNYKEVISLSSYLLGNLHSQKGELEEAIQHHILGLKLREELGKTYLIAQSIKSIILLYIELDIRNIAEEYLNRFRELEESTDNIRIKHRFQIANAIFLKTSESRRNRSKAEALLEQITTEDKINPEITIEALLNLCDLYLRELNETDLENEEKEILADLKIAVDRLMELARKQESYSLIVEVSMFQAVLSLFELKIDVAKITLSKALQLAQEKGMKKLAAKVSNELDHILEQLESWEHFTMRLPSIAERLELTHIEEKLYNIIRNRTIVGPGVDIEEEIPILFIILSAEGTIIFSEQFDETLIQETMETTLVEIRKILQSEDIEDLRRFKVEEYTCLLKKQKEFLIFYLYIGKSYSGIQKIDNFVKLLKKRSKLRNLIEETISSETTLSYQDRLDITKSVDEIFLRKK
ncbi:MAG: tetratricopeptide repeat protein [Candidatus Heimdallarchaeota archaeon]|nr:tetratricopeptide repeat protein [Candidatus Heimdallarchaeota archaeon]